MHDPDFNRFGLRHLSPSSVNTYLEEPAFWVVRYLMGARGRTGAKMARGTAVEDGVKGYFFSLAKTDAEARKFALSTAQNSFMMHIADDLAFRDSDDEEEFDKIPGYLTQVLDACDGVILPKRDMKPFVQVRVSMHFDGVPVETMGYLDFDWPDWPFIFDLKTTDRVLNEASKGHGRQISLYAEARKKAGVLIYASTKRLNKVTVSWEDHAQHLGDLRRGARAITQLLRRSTSVEEVAELFVPQYDSYYWDEETVDVAERLWK